MKIIVIGAGIVGVACAHALLDEGHDVEILDREGPAAGTSQGNAGGIANTEITPMASPKMLRRVPGFLLDPLGPLAIRPAYALRAAPWLLRFVASARPGRYRRNADALFNLQARVADTWRAMAAKAGVEHLVHRRGGLTVYDDAAVFERHRPLFERQRAIDADLELVDGPAIRRLEPALSERFVAGLHHPNTAHVSDPRAMTLALFDSALARGATFRKAEVRAIEPGARPSLLLGDAREKREADRILLAAGIWSKPLAKMLGDSVPLESERGYNVSFPGVTGVIARMISFEGHGFVVSPLDSGLRVGGAVEFAGLDAAPNHARTRAFHAKAQRFLDGVPSFEQGSAWMGHRPSLPDSLPVIGQSTASSAVLYAFGHGHYGLTQSAATGELIAQLIAGRPTSIDLTPFSAQRF